MRITAVEEYGLRALLCLARKAKETNDLRASMTIPEIAEGEGLSIPYASKILRKLRQGGLVAASRGRIGGYHLVGTPAEITLHRALVTLGGPVLAPDHCARYSGTGAVCVHDGECSLRGAFGGLAQYMENFLSKVTLADLSANETEVGETFHRIANSLEGKSFRRTHSATNESADTQSNFPSGV